MGNVVQGGGGVPSAQAHDWPGRCRQGNARRGGPVRSAEGGRGGRGATHRKWPQGAGAAVQVPLGGSKKTSGTTMPSPLGPPCLPSVDSLATLEEPEAARLRFRGFCYQEVAGPQEALAQLRELCRQWLQPEITAHVLKQGVLPAAQKTEESLGGPPTSGTVEALKAASGEEPQDAQMEGSAQLSCSVKEEPDADRQEMAPSSPPNPAPSHEGRLEHWELASASFHPPRIQVRTGRAPRPFPVRLQRVFAFPRLPKGALATGRCPDSPRPALALTAPPGRVAAPAAGGAGRVGAAGAECGDRGPRKPAHGRRKPEPPRGSGRPPGGPAATGPRVWLLGGPVRGRRARPAVAGARWPGDAPRALRTRGPGGAAGAGRPAKEALHVRTVRPRLRLEVGVCHPPPHTRGRTGAGPGRRGRGEAAAESPGAGRAPPPPARAPGPAELRVRGVRAQLQLEVAAGHPSQEPRRPAAPLLRRLRPRLRLEVPAGHPQEEPSARGPLSLASGARCSASVWEIGLNQTSRGSPAPGSVSPKKATWVQRKEAPRPPSQSRVRPGFNPPLTSGSQVTSRLRAPHL
ncbi:zinc finger protein 446 isoform X2 [Equus quagga]|uniref:zinc finger protein 446 isoform X2 n=1 Tax=Equus quagga TaxID=89248 RepID=UPI001EE1C2F7|nr:zinc finger protein 446 isoform X2 [Equus quagga]